MWPAVLSRENITDVGSTVECAACVVSFSLMEDHSCVFVLCFLLKKEKTTKQLINYIETATCWGFFLSCLLHAYRSERNASKFVLKSFLTF